jgi:hypothetical protein
VDGISVEDLAVFCSFPRKTAPFPRLPKKPQAQNTSVRIPDENGPASSHWSSIFAAKEAADASLLRKLVECKLRAFDPQQLEGNEQARRLVNSNSTWQELHVYAIFLFTKLLGDRKSRRKFSFCFQSSSNHQRFGQQSGI